MPKWKMKYINFKWPYETYTKLRSKERKRKSHIDWGEIFHVVFNAALPFALVLLINLDLTLIAVIVVFLSKWRMFAVRLNYLPANIRANATDLVVKLSALSFMVLSESLAPQLIIATGYAIWLLLMKPQTSKVWVSLQSLIAQLVGITAVMLYSNVLNEVLVLAAIWSIIYVTSYHFLSDFDEAMSRVLAKIWALLGLELAWLFIHWNLAYFAVIPQYALVQVALSAIAGDWYISVITDKLDAPRIRFYIVATVVVVLVMIVSADWNGQIA